MRTSPYQLADEVFMCLSNGRLVFLDLRRNKYLCLNQRNTQAVISIFTGCDKSDAKLLRPVFTTDRGNTKCIVEAMADSGFFAQHGTKGKEATAVCIQMPVNVLLSEESRLRTAVRLSHWSAFLQASLKASWKLRSYSMRRTVQSVKNRKQRRVKSQITDHDALRDLVAIFHHLRPFYARKYLCLYDSLALVEFLAHYRLFPQWVFGVTAEPFNAHCWVQENDCVLNDTVEYVRGFTPIMVV